VRVRSKLGLGRQLNCGFLARSTEKLRRPRLVFGSHRPEAASPRRPHQSDAVSPLFCRAISLEPCDDPSFTIVLTIAIVASSAGKQHFQCEFRQSNVRWSAENRCSIQKRDGGRRVAICNDVA
jgi:hypothetical protein